jgi:fibronectin-binding autotransporter adhesin
MKTLITAALFLISLSSLSQQVCEWNGLADANWNNPENWTLAIVPSTGDSVIIHDGPFDTFLNTDISFSFLSIDSAATLSLGAINLTLTGDVENNGVLNSGLSRVIFNGTVQQTICGDITFNKLEINNAAGVEIGCGLTSLKGVLYLTDGIFYTNHMLLLLSDSSNTASVATIENGAIIGHVTFQRHMDVVADDWRFLSSPIHNFKLNQITDDFWTSGFAGATYPTDPFVSVYFYDETDSGTADYGYVAPVSALDLVQMGTGFMAYIGTGSLTSTIDFTGDINKGTIELPVTYTLTDTVSDGWNLVGNPYPSAIDWNDSTILKTGIDNAIYIWNPELGVYSSYVDGIGTNGGSSVIASAQSFYVKANAAGPAVELTEACKTEATSVFF